ncbi:MAG: hypothetical protein AB8B48_01190 [Pseudomonadales bacterium]
MSERIGTNANDWVANKGRFIAAWGLPAVLMIITGLIQFPPMTIGILWCGALTWMGYACLRNARQCGRMHCFFSDPYFLFSAVLALVVGMQWTPFLSFNSLGLFLLIGMPLVTVLPEVFGGTYKLSKKGSN